MLLMCHYHRYLLKLWRLPIRVSMAPLIMRTVSFFHQHPLLKFTSTDAVLRTCVVVWHSYPVYGIAFFLPVSIGECMLLYGSINTCIDPGTKNIMLLPNIRIVFHSSCRKLVHIISMLKVETICDV